MCATRLCETFWDKKHFSLVSQLMLLSVGALHRHAATQQVKTWPLRCHLSVAVPEEVCLNCAASATASRGITSCLLREAASADQADFDLVTGSAVQCPCLLRTCFPCTHYFLIAWGPLGIIRVMSEHKEDANYSNIVLPYYLSCQYQYLVATGVGKMKSGVGLMWFSPIVLIGF